MAHEELAPAGIHSPRDPPCDLPFCQAAGEHAGQVSPPQRDAYLGGAQQWRQLSMEREGRRVRAPEALRLAVP